MRLTVFLNGLGLGGTEKAAGIWARHLSQDPSFTQVRILSLADGPRRQEWEKRGLEVRVVDPKSLPDFLTGTDVIHAHAPGFPHAGDVLGDALTRMGRKIPVVQTNIFGKLENPREEKWTDFRLFISWTSCVQAARRSGRKLDANFFRHQSVASYPVEPWSDAELADLKIAARNLREGLGLEPHHVLFGRFSRPEPNKWTPMLLPAFMAAHKKNSFVRLLLREPPPTVAAFLQKEGLVPAPGTKDPAKPVQILPATADGHALAASQFACDVILHTSSIGESFGYGIAEPMALGKPVITHSVPWHDQAQLELVRHQETGLIASTESSLKKAVLQLAGDATLRQRFGQKSLKHIQSVASPEVSTRRLTMALGLALKGRENPEIQHDLETVRLASMHLDRCQWGFGGPDYVFLRLKAFWANSLRVQKSLRQSLRGRS